MKKKLYRSKKEKIVAGVLGGLGGYMDVDPSVLRLAFIFLVVLTGVFPFVVAYILAAVIVPAREEESQRKENGKNNPLK